MQTEAQIIKKINHQEIPISEAIFSLFQASFIAEAEFLRVKYFPPLKRTVDDFVRSETEFFALLKDQEMVAVVEIMANNECTEIRNLAVHPAYFRQGLGMQLMLFILRSIDSAIFTVETGLNNKPAIKLYKKLGFQEVDQWDTSFGVRKVKFKKVKDNYDKYT